MLERSPHVSPTATGWATSWGALRCPKDPTAGRYWRPDTTGEDLTQRIITDLTTPIPTPAPTASATTTERGVFTLPAQITTPAEAEQLAHHLLDPDRSRPLVLLSVAVGATHPWADEHEIRSSLGAQCDVVVLPTGDASRAFARRLPRGCEAYGGAGRVYPVGVEWLHDLDKAPLRFAYDPREGLWQTRALIRDAWTALGGSATVVGPAVIARPASGTVLGIVGGRGLARLSGGGTATIWPEMIVADLEAEQLLARGMAVEGLHYEGSGQLDITGMRQAPAVALAAYRSGDQVLAQVVEVTVDTVVVALLPGVHVAVGRSQVTTSELPLTDLMSLGEVLVVRLVGCDPWELSLDVDDQQPLRVAPSILVGGPAWLTPPITDEQPSPDDETPAEAETSKQVVDEQAEWVREREQLIAQLQRAKQASQHARRETQEARTRLRGAIVERDRALADLRALQEATGRAADDQHLFTDPEEQLRFEVTQAWARRIPAAQKTELPLRPWTVGEDFLVTVAQVHGLDRGKLVDVIVEIFTDMVAHLDGRELHALRSSDAGNAPAVTRADGSTCYRAAIQRCTPSARRIHYWSTPQGRIELSSVRLHDDMRP